MLENKEQIEAWLDEMKIQNYSINDDLTVDVDENVYLLRKGLTELPIQFEMVTGDFECSHNKLTNLKGCPRIVKGNFYCNSNEITSLKGCPKVVKGNFNCSDNKLKSLEGCPEIIEGEFNCNRNNLTSFEYLPIQTGGDFYHDGIKEQGIEPNTFFKPGTTLEDLHKRNDIINSKKSLEEEFKSKDLTKEEVKRPKMKI